MSEELAEDFDCRVREKWERDTLEEEASRARIKQDIKELDEIERDLLRRTLLVTNVRGMNDPMNRRTLQRFLGKKFGRVEFCEVTCFSNDEETNRLHRSENPPVRVRFTNISDAKRVFGGKDLLGLLDRRSFKHHLGSQKDDYGKFFFVVQPSYRYPGMLDGSLKRRVVTIKATRMALGHFLPHARDSYMNVFSDPNVRRSNLWLEEFSTDVKPACTIDIHSQTVELRIRRNYDDYGNFCFKNSTDFANFPFKCIIQGLELCRIQETGQYAIAMSLKYPPRLETQKDPWSGFGFMFYTEERQRTVRFGSVPADHFGKSTAILLYFEDEVLIEGLFRNDALQSVKNCGLIKYGVESLEDATLVSQRRLAAETKLAVKKKIELIHERSPKIGFILRSILDHGRTTYHHLLNDVVDGMNLLDYILTSDNQTEPTNIDAKIFNCLTTMCHSTTRYPLRLCLRLMNTRQADASGSTLVGVTGRPIGGAPDANMAIPRILVSPSRMVVQKFEDELGNCVVRKFCQEKGFPDEAFIRVHVGEENGNKLFFQDLVEPVVKKLREVILAGLVINGKMYEFLAYSSSQLKEMAFWMVAPSEGWSVEEIVRDLGDFSEFSSAPKFASRIGLRFSTTYRSLTMSRSLPCAKGLRYRIIGDITSQYCGRTMVHSDGNGMIRRSAANAVLQCIPSSPKELREVSILQIRAGGAKGTVLVVDCPEIYSEETREDEDATVDVFIRHSMIKFKAPDEYLEVCRIGKHAPYYLNRNVILLLVKHGIPDKAFLQMETDFLNNLDQMLTDRDTAAQMLPRCISKEAGILAILQTMIQMGLSPLKDPFLFSCLHAIRSHCHFGLRKKCRILVPKGAVLMGAIDVTGLLPEGCIFVSIRQNGPHSNFEPLQGPCMVTKHPVMAPGDIRMLLAVDINELRGFSNVVLFSQHGERPEADKMAGSDLDGDEFAVTWDRQLFLGEWCICKRDDQNRWVSSKGTVLYGKSRKVDAAILVRVNANPLDYHLNEKTQAQGKLDAREQTLTETLIDHFFEYAKNNNLGMIGMLWQDYAAKFGADCRQCIELAIQHSIAVDYAKTGVAAYVPRYITLSRLHPRAHWREMKKTPSFEDNKSIIGKLYNKLIDRLKQNVLSKCTKAIAGRQIDRYGQVLSILDKSDVNSNDHLRRVFDKSLLVNLKNTPNQTHLNFARQQRRSFERRIVAIMNEHGLRSEGEVFTGCIRKYHKMNKRRQFETSQDVLRRSGNLCEEFRDNFFRKVLDLAQCATAGSDFSPAYFGVASGDDAKSDVDPTKLDRIKRIILEGGTDKDDDLIALEDTAHRLAVAYYIVTYDPDARWIGDPDQGQVLFGFPWIVAEILQKNKGDHSLE